MAGDWIKIEKATIRKPEVLAIADVLKIHHYHALGLCIAFWSWCDDQMIDGHVPTVTDVTLDAVIGHAQFASALRYVGWLQVRNGSLEVPNFARHLSESAKARALSGKRKRKQRSKNPSRFARDTCVTREESSLNLDKVDHLEFSCSKNALANYLRTSNKLHPRTAAERSLLAKAAYLAGSKLSEHWLHDAVEAVLQVNPDNPCGYFRKCLQAGAKKFDEDFEDLARAVVVPKAFYAEAEAEAENRRPANAR